MSNMRSTRRSGLIHILRRYFVSAFVVFAFAAYAVHERVNGADTGAALPPTPTVAQTRQDNVEVTPSTLPIPTTDNTGQQDTQPLPPTFELPTMQPPSAIPPTAEPPTASAPTTSGQYK